jgi:ribosomal-protein-alanine N-acetyltransferase
MFALPFGRRPPPALSGPRVTLRHPEARDFDEWSSVREASREFLTPWEPQWTADELERNVWKQRLRRYREELRHGSGVAFLIRERKSGALAGGISIGNIRYGVAQTGQIGYWMSKDYAGKGLMVESVELVLRHGFETLRLHRIEAACIPDNRRSIRVLEKAGFQREGHLRSYLRINGAWRDHVLYARIADDGKTGREQGYEL